MTSIAGSLASQTQTLDGRLSRFLKSLFLTIALSTFCLPVISQAQPEDTQQPIEISAEQLISNASQGSSHYQGEVTIQQGTFKLSGDQVIIKHPNNELDSILAKGQPATFEQFNTTDNAWIRGQAEEIYYDAAQKVIRLTRQAEVIQENKHQIRGDNLIYDMQQKTLQGQGNPQQRIQVILQPNQQSVTNQDSKMVSP